MKGRIKIFADGADVPTIRRLQQDPRIRGFTTNPTLMRKAGVPAYEPWARGVLEIEKEKPVSFEVLSEEPSEIIRQAHKIQSWGENVYVKIPAVTSSGESTLEVVSALAAEGVKVNVTAITSDVQAMPFVTALCQQRVGAYISIFAGRIADTGRSPITHVQCILAAIDECPTVEVIWASPRQLLDVVTADALGCHIITVTPDILKKLDLIGKDLMEYSKETAAMFATDAAQAGYLL